MEKKRKLYAYKNYKNTISGHENTFSFFPGYNVYHEKNNLIIKTLVSKKINSFFSKKNTFGHIFSQKNIEIFEQGYFSKTTLNPYVLYNFDKFMELRFSHSKSNSFPKTKSASGIFRGDIYRYVFSYPNLFQEKLILLIPILFIVKNLFSLEILWDFFLLASFYKIFFNLSAIKNLSGRKLFYRFFFGDNKTYTLSAFVLIWNSILRAGNLVAI